MIENKKLKKKLVSNNRIYSLQIKPRVKSTDNLQRTIAKQIWNKGFNTWYHKKNCYGNSPKSFSV